MPLILPNWMEEERINLLERERDLYEKEMNERYPVALWEHARETTQRLKMEHSLIFFKHIGIFTIAEIIIVNWFDGFAAGVLATIAFFIYLFVFSEYRKNEPDWDKYLDPRSEEDIKRGIALERRKNNPDVDKENWMNINNISENELQEEIEKERAESEKRKFFIHCPRPISEYSGGPAIIFTVIKDKNMPIGADDHRIICLRLEEVTEKGERTCIDEREYGGWPLSWSRDEACETGYERNLPVFGEDVLYDFTNDN